MKLEPSSFRDPSGFVFYDENNVFRQLNPEYFSEFKLFEKSGGLVQNLLKKELILSYQTVERTKDRIILKVPKIPFISYPYEWSFGQLQDAALLTLKIQKMALSHEMSLKDASAYNIQFIGSSPVLIDVASFEQYKEGSPWVAYRQFCQHFLAPLLLMVHCDYRLNQLSRIYIDGIPLDLVSKLLPRKTWFSLGIVSHIHFHAKTQARLSNKADEELRRTNINVGRINLLAIIDNLENTVRKLKLKRLSTEWGDYYTFTNYSETAFVQKKKIISNFIQTIGAKTVWDLGANTGQFSDVTADKGVYTISLDSDFLAVERNYLRLRKDSSKNILPLVIDLTNPSSAIGWQNTERKSVIERGPADCVMALALIHHLAISNNVPLNRIAEFFSQTGIHSIVEFVPKEDSQVKKLLTTRQDIFPDYNIKGFETAFNKYFQIVKKQKIEGSSRIIYLMKRK